jgi:DNA mismatch endonuclease (patch repair protein)
LRHQHELRELGWQVLVVWECEMTDTTRVASIVKNFLCSAEGRLHEIS